VYSFSTCTCWFNCWKPVLLLVSIVVIICSATSSINAQQSTSGPVPPEDLYRGRIYYDKAQVVIPNVPAYLWHHGCGPTAVGMVVGYWDNVCFKNFIYGNAASQTPAVEAMMAADNGDPSCGNGLSDHYQDYACPLNNGPDRSELGGAHTDNCVADYMKTSQSAYYNNYGWSWFSHVAGSFTSFVNQVDPQAYPVSFNRDYYEFTWEDYKYEIDNNRPVVLLVDTDGNGSTDHFITAIGYNDVTMEYAAFDTWNYSTHWYLWRPLQEGNTWGIYGITTFELMGIEFDADTTYGWGPLDVTFEGFSPVAVDILQWDFGDGNTANLSDLTPITHTYTELGMHNVSLSVNYTSQERLRVKNNYVIILADTLIADTITVSPDTSVCLTIFARNYAPIDTIRIPIECVGDLSLTLDSFNTVGCRTDYFDIVDMLNYDPFNKRFTFRLGNSASSGLPPIDPGYGPILNVFFHVNESALNGQTVNIILDGYNTYVPRFAGPLIGYLVPTSPGFITVEDCLQKGDFDKSGQVDISDLVFFVNYSFNGGIAPDPIDIADVDCSGTIDISDLVYLVNYMFLEGPEPCACE